MVTDTQMIVGIAGVGVCALLLVFLRLRGAQTSSRLREYSRYEGDDFEDDEDEENEVDEEEDRKSVV